MNTYRQYFVEYLQRLVAHAKIVSSPLALYAQKLHYLPVLRIFRHDNSVQHYDSHPTQFQTS